MRNRPWENQPSSHLVMTVEIPILKVLFSVYQLMLVLGQLCFVELD